MAVVFISTVCLVEILTTASITASATSAMPSGPRACAGAVSSGQAIAAAAKIANPKRPARCVIGLRIAPMGVNSPGTKALNRDSAAGFTANQGHRPSTPWEADSPVKSASHQPYQDQADHRRADANNAQGSLRRFQHARHRPLGGAGKSGKDQAERGEKIFHA